ncbi:MAG: DUF4280 domain-containing protein [Candidatus Symbiothrix sp.]|jgi:hypothetical protein|nr:DUF4280 domain-containing protein [Candidatus Symbiothrix sp.]
MAQPVKNETSEERERNWKDPNELLKFVCERGKVMCPYCSVPVGRIKVTSNTISLQDAPWVTTGDRDGKTNLDFQGTCLHPSQKSPPCKAVINLGKWENYSEVHINNKYALIVKSTIPCLVSGMDIKIVHSGQTALLTSINPILLKQLIVEKEYFTTVEATVCHELKYQAVYREYGYPVENKLHLIRWKVKFTGRNGEEDKEVKLEEVEEIKKTRCQLTGHEIFFPVPQEWRYRNITLIAYMLNDKSVEAVYSRVIFIKDHIVAAFYRVENTKAIPFRIHNVSEQAGTGNILVSEPVYHIQGMYKEGNRYYFAGSTKPQNPAYVLTVNECPNENCEGGYERCDVMTFGDSFDEETYDDNLACYTHPGGLQSANGVLAVGLEKYKGGRTKINDAMLCFYDTMNMKEYKNMRMRLKDRASAVGIVYYKNKWIVAVRVNNGTVVFYSFSEKDTALTTIKEFKNIKEFQNLNLFLDEEEQIYMFGMESTKLPVLGDGTKTNFCWIYKVDIEDKEIYATWKDEDGYIQYKNYENIEENKIRFITKLPTSFQWSSCVHIQKNENTGIEEDRKEDPNFIGNEDTGFIGKFTVYASDNNVKEKAIKKEGVQYTVRRKPATPVIECNLFQEEKVNK